MTSVIRANIWQNGAGVNYNAVLQVARAVKTNTWSAATSGNNFYDVTGLAVTIAPRFATSLIVLMSTLYLSTNNAYQQKWRYTRNGNTFLLGDAEGGRPQATGMVNTYYAGSGVDGAQYQLNQAGGIHWDLPGSTAAQTYQIQAASYSGTTIFLNRNSGWQNAPASGYDAVPVSSLVVMEIAQ
jgi:hypothetical protein